MGMSVAAFAADALITVDQVTGYTISDYRFSVTGKTAKSALRRTIAPSGEEPIYKSEEALVKALDNKRQLLVNTQLFIDVDYTYEVVSFDTGLASYVVTFFVQDSKTLIILPYPKFDNDETGLLLGVKAKDTNFFGTFGELNFTGYTAQNDGTLESWENRKDHLELYITDLYMLNTSMKVALIYDRERTDNPDGSFDYAVSTIGIPIFSTKLDIAFDGDVTPTNDNFSFNYNVGLRDLSLMKTSFGLRSWGKLHPTWNLDEANAEVLGFGFNYGPFYQNGGRYSLNATAEWYEYLTKIKIAATLTQHDLNFLGLPFSFNINAWGKQQQSKTSMDEIFLGATLGTRFSLPFGLKWSVSASEGVSYTRSNEAVKSYLEVSNTLSNSGRIDYISSAHKFRKGLVFSFKHVMRQYQQDAQSDSSYWYVEGSATWFPFAFWRMNPSVRLNGFYMGDQTKQFKFLPSNEDVNLNDYFRGFLNRSGTLSHLNSTKLTYGAVMNLNLTIDFIDFGFAKSYAVPFLDIGVFGDPDAENGQVLLANVGLEGWGVLKKYPSHPMRVALGMNFFDLMEAFKGEREASAVEWKLTISFELYY
jgi:hypothetical protein